jgi:hypothetical protein
MDARHGQDVEITTDLHEKFVLIFAVLDNNDDPVDLTGKSLVFSIRTTESGTATETLTTAAGTITINTSVVTMSKTLSVSSDVYFHDLLNVTDDKTIMDGKLLANYTGRGE